MQQPTTERRTESQEIFGPVRDLGPSDLFDLLEQCAVLLPEEVRYRLKRVVASAADRQDGLERALEIVRAQWEGLQAPDSINLALLGPAGTGKASLLAALGEGDIGRISGLFSMIDLQGLEEYLGYGKQDRVPSELDALDAILILLDGSRGFTDATDRMVRLVCTIEKPVLLILTKMDLVSKPRKVVNEAKSLFRLPVIPVSVAEEGTIRRLLRSIVAACPRALYPLTQNLPGFRRSICRGIASQSAFACGLVGAIPLPIGDLLPVSAIQVGMVLKIARAHGFSISRGRARELIPVLAAGLLVREGVHKIADRYPDRARMVSIAVGGVWTYMIGRAAIHYFDSLSRSALLAKEEGAGCGA